MKKKLLIFSWEYYGYHSIGGAALSRRVKQVAESFENNEWEVTVIHNDQRNECENKQYVIHTETNGIRRITVGLKKYKYNYNRFALLRKIQTFYYVALHGERSYVWAKNVLACFDELGIQNPDLIISFFTPCGPLFLGDYFSKKLTVPWIADFQDTFDEGVSGGLIYWRKLWMKKTLKTANAVTHVSPEWAQRDGEILGLDIKVIRHAVPDRKIGKIFAEHNISPTSFKIFYGGSLNEAHQSLSVLKNVLNSSRPFPVPVDILIAASEGVYRIFQDKLSEVVNVVHLGWLSSEDYAAQIAGSNCCLVIPWSTPPRQVIPSKLYELCAFQKPIWIIGDDTGAFTHLLQEWQHPDIAFGNVDFQKNAFMSALQNDYSKMFNIEQCKANYVKESDLFERYLSNTNLS